MSNKNLRSYAINVFNGMALGLFASLIIGLILKQLGAFLSIPILEHFGKIAQLLMAPAIGAGVALSVKSPPLGVFAASIAAAIGAGSINFTDNGAILTIGEPMGALVGSLVGAEVTKLIAGKTKVDIVLVPAATILAGGLAGYLTGPWIAQGMNFLGALINTATRLHPFPMGILVSVLMGIILTLPISSAALAIALGLNGLAAGAATVGCCCQMIGFAAQSYKDNGVGGLISQGLGTSMIQIPNIIRNPWIWVPPTLASAILGPVATMVFKMENNKVGAGMGTSGLVGQFGTIATMGGSGWVGIVTLHFLLPALLSTLFCLILLKVKKIRPGDMRL
ncbi:MAG: PTS sugar transporter subunit IIC [Aminobacterium colombiense]|nr:PTS sugar transporter subunit IIC [Aminobacterium colombiense]MDD3768412.1 PTS sugar transporter subunit IIC [Aminobacterium colombiense]